jgi:hypothetical protein
MVAAMHALTEYLPGAYGAAIDDLLAVVTV